LGWKESGVDVLCVQSPAVGGNGKQERHGALTTSDLVA
jgi:hypothetical protein